MGRGWPKAGGGVARPIDRLSFIHGIRCGGGLGIDCSRSPQPHGWSGWAPAGIRRAPCPSLIYKPRCRHQCVTPGGETSIPPGSQPGEERQHMGDRSPKANQKKATQKQAQATASDQKKKQAVAEKQVSSLKR